MAEALTTSTYLMSVDLTFYKHDNVFYLENWKEEMVDLGNYRALRYRYKRLEI